MQISASTIAADRTREYVNILVSLLLSFRVWLTVAQALPNGCVKNGHSVTECSVGASEPRRIEMTIVRAILAVAGLALGASVFAQSYPSRPVTIRAHARRP